jgi:hypothetical protein
MSECHHAIGTATASQPILSEETREWLFRRAIATLPRWLVPNDPLPEIPDWLKPGK